MSYRSDIQGLRALAVLVVIIFHYSPALMPGGFVGVDVFFAISGFLITSILLRKKAKVNAGLSSVLKGFYSGRIRRIVPAYFAMLVPVSLVSAVLFLESDFSYYGKGLKEALIFNSNNYFAAFGDYFAPGTHEQPLLHTWSLAVEMQFYLFFPFAVLLLSNEWIKRFLPLMLLSLLFITEYQLSIKGEGQNTYYSLYARIPEFLIGAAVALYSIGTSWTQCRANIVWVLGLAAVLASTQLITGGRTFPGLLSLLPVVGAAMLIAAGNASYRVLLSNKLFVWIGALSYSLYLWHWPVLALVRYYTGEAVLNTFTTMVFISLTLLLSSLSYYLVETHCNSRKYFSSVQKTSTLQLLLIPLLVLLGCAGFYKASFITNDYFSPAQLPVEYTRYADPSTICHGKIVGDCLKGDLKSHKELLVLGDSHAAMLTHFFDYIGKDQGFKARIITASSCVTIPEFDYNRLSDWAQKPCFQQMEEAKKFLDSATDIVIAGMWSFQLSSEDFVAAMDDFLSANSAGGKRVYVLSQIPLLTIDPMRHKRFQSLGIPRISADPNTEYLNANKYLKQLIIKFPAVQYIEQDLLGFFDSSSLYNGKLAYFDESHLNEFGALKYAQTELNVFQKRFSKLSSKQN